MRLRELVDEVLDRTRAPEGAQLAASVYPTLGVVEVRVETVEWVCVDCGRPRVSVGPVTAVSADSPADYGSSSAWEHWCGGCDRAVAGPTVRDTVVARSDERDLVGDVEDIAADAVRNRIEGLVGQLLDDDAARLDRVDAAIRRNLGQLLDRATDDDADGIIDSTEPGTIYIDSGSRRLAAWWPHPRTGEVIEQFLDPAAAA